MKKRKLLSAILSIAMILTMLPISAFAGGKYEVVSVDKTVVNVGDDVHVTVTLPGGIETAGSFTVRLKFDKDLFTVKSRAGATQIPAYNEEDNEEAFVSTVRSSVSAANTNGVLASNAAYMFNTMEVAGVTVIDAVLTAKAAGTVEFSFDTFEITKSDGGTQYIVSDAEVETPPSITVNKAPMTSAAVTLTAPVKGAVAETAVSGTGFTGTVEWSPALSGGKFAGDTAYTANVTLTPAAGESFADGCAVTLNGDSVSASKTGDKLTFSKTFTATEAKVLQSIAITTPPTKTDYVEGQSFDPDGMVVTATFDEGAPEDVFGYTVAPAGDLEISDENVTVSYTYGGVTKTATQLITVAAKEIDHIVVGTTGVKTLYQVGDALDTGNLKVVAYYNDGTNAMIAPDSVTGFDSAAVGVKTLTVTAGGKTATYEVTVEPKTVTIPSADSASFTYNGSVQTYNIAESEYYTVNDNKKTDAGSYTVTVALNNSTNTKWSDGTIANKTYTFTIKKADVTNKTATGEAKYGNSGSADLSALVVDGAPLTLGTTTDTNGILNGAVSLSGSTLNFNLKNDAANVGKTATVVVNAAATTNYNAYTIAVTLTAQDKLTPVVTASDYATTYNGNPVGVNVITKTESVEGTWTWKDSAPTNVADGGEKTLVFTPTDAENYKAVEKTVKVTINPAVLTISGVTATDREYNGTTAVALSGGTLSAIVLGDVVGFDLGTGTVESADAGNGKAVTTAITLTGADAGNYTLTQPTDISVNITPKTITVPTTGASTFYYSGSEQTFSISTNDAYTVNGNKQTYAGNYTATAALKDKVNTKWSDDSTADKSFQFTIKASNQSSLNYTSTASVTKGGNTLDLKSLVYNIMGGAEVSFSFSGSNNGCAIVDGVLTSGETSGTVKINISVAAADVNGDSVNEYNDRTVENAITVKVEDKTTATLTGVTQSGCTYGETLSDPSYTAPDGTSGTTVTYTGTLRKGGTYAASTTKPTEAGSYTVTVVCETATAIYTGASDTFTIAPKSIADADVTLGTALTYNGSNQTQTVTKVELDGTDITAFCDISDNTATNAGAQDLTVTAKDTSNYTGSVSKEFTVAKKLITPTINVTGSYTYTGSAITPSFTVKDGTTELAVSDYTADVTENTNAGTGKITVKEGTNGNYTFSETTENFTIGKASFADKHVFVSAKYGTVGSADLTSFIEYGAALSLYGLSDPNGIFTSAGAKMNSGWDGVEFTLKDDTSKIGESASITVKGAATANYTDYIITVIVTMSDKDPQATLTITGETTAVYNETITLGTTGGSGTGEVTYVVTPGTGDATVSGNVLTATKAGTVTVKAVKAADADYNQAESAPVEINIEKATPTGTPTYTAISANGKTLADAALAVGSITPDGTIVWNLGDAEPVIANTAYDWTFTPDDTVNYNNLTGSITPYRVSTGGEEPTSYAITVEEAEHGSVSADVKAVASGKTVTLTVTPDKGYTLETITVADKGGKEIELTIVKAGESYTFKMPAAAVTVKATFMEDNTMLNFFVDVPADAYYYDAVLWAAENGITSGVDAVHFDPNGTCTRAQIVTFLWRAAGCPEVETAETFSDVVKGSYYEKAVAWAVAEGITKGTSETTFSPNSTCTRAQTVTFLWRAAGSPAILNMTASGPANPFSDVAVANYYYDAVLWAAGQGITEGTTATTFSPNGTCTRAQVVTFLYRYMGK